MAYYGDTDVNDENTQILFSGVITAIQGILKELNIGETNSFETSEYRVMIFNEKNYALIFLLNMDSEMPDDDINRLYKRLNSRIKPHISATQIVSVDLDDIITAEIELWDSESTATRRAKESLW